MNRKMSRREALRWMAMAATASLVACQNRNINRSTTTESPTQADTRLPDPTVTEQPVSPTPGATGTTQPVDPTPDQAYLSVARGEDTAAITETALRALGGIERFVKNGYDVIIKPNICADNYPYEYGATTNPIVVATLVRLALGAGARQVRVMDFPFGGTSESAYAKSGIADAVHAAGGQMEVMNPNKYRLAGIPEGESLTQCMIYQDVLNCDLLIDVPTAKDHRLARVTAGCKNLLGIIRDRGAIHANMAQRIPDLVSLVRPGLTVIDAVRTLMAHGPTGGNLDDVKINNTVIASHDVVAADSYATGLFNLTGADIPYIVNAAERGLGRMNLSGLKIEEASL
ncbi:MAG: DUF362 domain-containing protein [Anaerolineae bacterium]|jgi:uncharacterized protein (DUF362 family)|nr:DUF362 domain-containing protein [Anaerolineae bacterium]